VKPQGVEHRFHARVVIFRADLVLQTERAPTGVNETDVNRYAASRNVGLATGTVKFGVAQILDVHLDVVISELARRLELALAVEAVEGRGISAGPAVLGVKVGCHLCRLVKGFSAVAGLHVVFSFSPRLFPFSPPSWLLSPRLQTPPDEFGEFILSGR